MNADQSRGDVDESFGAQLRARRLSADSRRIFNQVLAAMQAAEEYDSTDCDAYIRLMQAIIDEAAFRRDTCRRAFAMTG